jgi:hypothetical protein
MNSKFLRHSVVTSLVLSLRPHLSLSLFLVAPTLEHRASVKRFVSFHFLNPKTVRRAPWTSDQLVARPLPNTDIHASTGIRTHDPSVRAGEDGSCLRLRGHCDRRFRPYRVGFMTNLVCLTTLDIVKYYENRMVGNENRPI